MYDQHGYHAHFTMHELCDEVNDLVFEHRLRMEVSNEEGYIVSLDKRQTNIMA